MFRYFAALSLLAALLLTPLQAFCAEPQVYFSRHFTLWYYSEGDFVKLESLFREGPLKEISSYGPETEYLGGRLEELYSIALSRLGAAQSGRRLLVVLLERSAANNDLYNMRGLSVTDGSVKYDPATGALYVYPEKAGLCEFARELASAVMDTGRRIPGMSESRYLVSVPAGERICAGLAGYGLFY